MTLALFAYRGLTGLLDPALPLLLNRRVASGKEDAGRLQERRGYASRKRPDGPLIWMHGASIGESQILLLLFEAMKAERPDLKGLITTQTRTSSDLIARKGVPDLIHQMAPADTPFSVDRFLKHWSPDLAIFAEGDIWPNLVLKLDKIRIPRILVNARMTEKSFDGWQRVPALARKIFGGFETILAANMRTSDGLKAFAGRKVKLAGNLKYAAPAPSAEAATLAQLDAIIGSRPVLAAVSTHEGEEMLALDAWSQLKTDIPDLLLIIVPRHPDRAGGIRAALPAQNVYQRSENPLPHETDTIWLCDSFGEVGIWMRLARLVFMGGGQVGAGFHGHNPIEPMKLDRYVLSLPDVSNFQQEFDDLIAAGGASLVTDANDLAAQARPFLDGTMTMQRDDSKLSTYLAGDAPLLQAKEAALSLLKKGSRR